MRREIEYAKAQVWEGWASIPGDQAPVWLYEILLPRFGEKYCAADNAVCLVEPVDDARTAAESMPDAPVMRKMSPVEVLFRKNSELRWEKV
jgi:transposase, IS5 family